MKEFHLIVDIAKKFKTFNTLKRKLGQIGNEGLGTLTSESRPVPKPISSPTVVKTKTQPSPVVESKSDTKPMDLTTKENSPDNSSRANHQTISSPARMREQEELPSFVSPNFFAKSRLSRSSSLRSFSLASLSTVPSIATPMTIDEDHSDEEPKPRRMITPPKAQTKPRNKRKRKDGSDHESEEEV